MGHAVNAAVLATVLGGVVRNARRAGVELDDRHASPMAVSATYVRWGEFVTGLVVRIDLRTQTATIINAGHPPPLRLRHGRVDSVALDSDPPFGIVRGID